MDSTRPAPFPRPLRAFHALVVLALASGLGTRPAGTAQAPPPLALRELAAVGAPAPGMPAGTTIATIGDGPRLDAQGNVTWAVTLRTPAGGFGGQAIYRRAGGATALLFASGDPAPGTGERFVFFPGFPEAPRISGGGATFATGITDAAVGGRHGVWSDRFGGFERLLVTGDRLPGIPAANQVAGFGFAVRGDTVLARATYSSDGNVAPGNEGIWRNRSGAWEPVVVRGMAAPGTGGVFEVNASGIFGPVFGLDSTGDGEVLVQGWARGRGIDAANDEGLWLETASGLQLLAREGARAPAPGRGKVTFGPGGSSPAFGGDGENLLPVVNDLGRVLFGAVLSSDKTRWSSVWTTRSGGLEQVARGGLPISGYGEGDQAPGFPAGVGFAAFLGGDLNRDGDLALYGFADESGSLQALTEAIWWDRPGALALVAAEGRTVPGIAGARYWRLALEALTDEGSLYFTAVLAGSGVDAGNDFAAFRVRADGGLGVVLREGDRVEVVSASGARTTRTVASFSLSPGVETAGRAAARVGFREGGGGVFLIDPLP